MAVQFLKPLTSRDGILGIIFGLFGFGSLGLLLLLVTIQVVNPPPAQRFSIERDIPLPSSLPDQYIPDVLTQPTNEGPLTPGVAIRFDHFDFQAFDPNTQLLFINHTGPAPDTVESTFHTGFAADKNAAVDGNVIVFDTQQKKLVARLPIPQGTGMVAAPDRGHVYAVDSNDNIVFDIDEKTLKMTQVPVGDNESPDAIEYDSVDQKLFVSDPGVPAPNAKDQFNASPDNQNLAVINLKTNKVSKINMGHMPKLPDEHADLIKFGYDVGHNKYDPILHRVFFTTEQLTDLGIAPSPAPEPAGTSELVEVDPVTQKIIARLQLPKTCGVPHGFNLDAGEHIGFIACTEVDPAQNLVQNLLRVDLEHMQVIPGPFTMLASKPDIINYDHLLHVLFVACGTGLSVFDVHQGTLTKLGDYVLGKGTHTIAINESTNEIYLPMPDVGGRPTLRIAVYHPDGV